MRVPLADVIRLNLSYAPPYDWEQVRDFFRMRAIPGVELAEEHAYIRTVRVGDRTGFIRVTPRKKHTSLRLEISRSLARARDRVAHHVRRMFDLDADPAAIGAQLSRDPRLAHLVELRPGLRVPRAFDGAEMAARAILGQQVTVAAARTLAGRIARTFGEPIETPFAGVDRVWPAPLALAGRADALVTIPLTRARAKALAHLMTEIADDRLSFAAIEMNGFGARKAPTALLDATRMEAMLAQMDALPGIGPWTANYIAMRGLAWSDAFPEGDLVLRQALGGATARACRERAERWRPFRAYATLHLWTNHTRG
jgi:AraC family transcriptional regulator of adaptative response / DNA-3-methyladenine glycosylase II